MNTIFKSARNNQSSQAFTLTDLIVMLAVLAVLGTILIPAHASSRANGLTTQCLENKRRLAAAWTLYASDHNDTLMPNPGWVGGTMNWDPANPDNFDSAKLVDPGQSQIAGYVQSAALFKCPADIYKPATFSATRVRSVSLNGALSGTGGGCAVQGHNPAFSFNGITYVRTYYGLSGGGLSQPRIGTPAKKMSDLNTPGPARIFLILDEHSDSINDGSFLHDPGYNRTSERWRDLPAGYHEGAAGISYTDGHAETHRWEERAVTGSKVTLYPIVFFSPQPSINPWANVSMNRSKDYEWLESGIPYKMNVQ